MYHSIYLANAFVICLSLLMITGCASHDVNLNRQQVIDLTGSEVSQYWVTKDKLIDWQQMLPPETDTEKHAAVYEVSFVVNTDGQMDQVRMINTNSGAKIPAEQLVGVSEYQFHATAQNINRQAVRVNATVEL